MTAPTSSAGRWWNRSAWAVAVAVSLLVAGCGGGGEQPSSVEAGDSGCTEVNQPVARKLDLKPPGSRRPDTKTVAFKTNCGEFTVALDPRAPKTTASFQYLAGEGAFDSTPFHRISTELGIVQGGDPQGDGFGGPGYSIDELPPPNLSYTAGTVAMAKSPAEPPGRSGSQFFVVYKADAGLPPDYALVGKISKGMDTIDRIAALADPASSDGGPTIPVVIDRARPGS